MQAWLGCVHTASHFAWTLLKKIAASPIPCISKQCKKATLTFKVIKVVRAPLFILVILLLRHLATVAFGFRHDMECPVRRQLKSLSWSSALVSSAVEAARPSGWASHIRMRSIAFTTFFFLSGSFDPILAKLTGSEYYKLMIWLRQIARAIISWPAPVRNKSLKIDTLSPRLKVMDIFGQAFVMAANHCFQTHRLMKNFLARLDEALVMDSW